MEVIGFLRGDDPDPGAPPRGAVHRAGVGHPPPADRRSRSPVRSRPGAGIRNDPRPTVGSGVPSAAGPSTQRRGDLRRQGPLVPRRIVLFGRTAGVARRVGRRVPRPHGHPVADAAILLLSAMVVVLLATIGVRAVLTGGGPGEATMNRATTLNATAPLGWSRQALWSSPALLKGVGRVLPVSEDVALVTAQRELVLVEAATGDTRWTRTLPEGPVRTSLALTTVAGRDAVAIHVGRRLTWWQTDSGEEQGVDLPAGAVATFLGEAPLVGLDAHTVATLSQDGSLQRYDVPVGAVALAAQPDGRVTATSRLGWWHLSPGAPAGPVRPFPPLDPRTPAGQPAVLSYLSGHLVTLWPSLAGLPAQVAVYSDLSENVGFSFSGPVVEAPQPGNGTTSSVQGWRSSPSGSWGIVNRTLVDVLDGRVQDLGRWTTSHVAEDRALGKVGGSPAIVGPDIPLGLLTRGEAFPEAMTAAGVAVRASEGDAESIYLLPWAAQQ